MKRLRPASEAEVIAEFLRGEFHGQEYHGDRERYEDIVLNPDYDNPAENEVRRSLLLRRHRYIWGEVPKDTQWWLVQLDVEDLPRVRVFPRGDWPKMVKKGPLTAENLVRAIKAGEYSPSIIADVSSIQAISYRMRVSPGVSSIVMIGEEENGPGVILEGNHRFIAAVMASPEFIRSHFTVYCGFSPRMDECLWYRSSLANVIRYGRNRLQYFLERFNKPAEPKYVPAPQSVQVDEHSHVA